MLSRHLSRCLVWAGSLILAATCGAQVPQNPAIPPDGQQTQGPPPQVDNGSLPSNPFDDNTPDTGPQNGQENGPPDANAPQDNGQPDAAEPAPEAMPENQGQPEENPQPPTQQQFPTQQPPAVQRQAPQNAARPMTQPQTPPRAVPESLLNIPAEPARVTLSDGQLSVRAANSSLSAILHQLASDSGMKVDGLSEDQRVFGTYGPGNPRDVLTALLDGANYNVLMVGSTQKGAPRELILTPRSNAPVSSPQSFAAAQQDQEEEQGFENTPQPVMMAPPPAPAQGVPPGQIQQQQPNGTVKTPAQILQELQRMRAQQQQGQQPPQ